MFSSNSKPFSLGLFLLVSFAEAALTAATGEGGREGAPDAPAKRKQGFFIRKEDEGASLKAVMGEFLELNESKEMKVLQKEHMTQQEQRMSALEAKMDKTQAQMENLVAQMEKLARKAEDAKNGMDEKDSTADHKNLMEYDTCPGGVGTPPDCED